MRLSARIHKIPHPVLPEDTRVIDIGDCRFQIGPWSLDHNITAIYISDYKGNPEAVRILFNQELVKESTCQ